MAPSSCITETATDEQRTLTDGEPTILCICYRPLIRSPCFSGLTLFPWNSHTSCLARSELPTRRLQKTAVTDEFPLVEFSEKAPRQDKAIGALERTRPRDGDM